MQHVLHINNTGRDTTAYELIIIYIKPNCISSKFQISKANPRSQTYPPIYIMQRWKREWSRGIPSQGRGGRFPPTFPTPNPLIWGRNGGGGGRRWRLGWRGLGSGRGRKGGERRKGAALALLTPLCRARRGGAASLPRRCMWRGRPGPTPTPRATPGQHGTPAASLHVAWQRLSAAPRRQARPKGSPGAKKILQGLIL
jgi:hypothetical protein